MPVCLADAFSPIKDNDYLDSVAAYFIPSFMGIYRVMRNGIPKSLRKKDLLMESESEIVEEEVAFIIDF
ncbi:hypothetical protein LWS67_12965 [Bacillus atrophaeus]|uniref:hypothetical protein n=1 Tax=Bacillus atrophaeus TaxID=1452 RepID=UPI001EFAC55B|nr:hypothetical protein [Bacillus atrophaeus]MCG8397456.1 hypothetical protein [Bacillus atrophaeus]